MRLNVASLLLAGPRGVLLLLDRGRAAAHSVRAAVGLDPEMLDGLDAYIEELIEELDAAASGD